MKLFFFSGHGINAFFYIFLDIFLYAGYWQKTSNEKTRVDYPKIFSSFLCLCWWFLITSINKIMIAVCLLTNEPHIQRIHDILGNLAPFSKVNISFSTPNALKHQSRRAAISQYLSQCFDDGARKIDSLSKSNSPPIDLNSALQSFILTPTTTTTTTSRWKRSIRITWVLSLAPLYEKTRFSGFDANFDAGY